MMNILIPISLLLSFISFAYCANEDNDSNNDNKVIEVNLLDKLDMSIYIYFGSEMNKSHCQRISLSKPFTWITSESYNSSESSSFKFIQNTELDFGYTKVKGEESTETVKVKDYSDSSIMTSSINDFHFYLINKSRYYDIRDSCIGLAYQFPDHSFSIVHQLFQANHISRLAFGFYPFTLSNGLFYFGGLPQRKIKNFYSAFCRVIRTDSHWRCSFTQVYITDSQTNVIDDKGKETNTPMYIYDNSDPSHFQSSETKIYAPRKFMLHLVETVFKPFIDDKQCLFDIQKGFAVIKCKDDIIISQYYINFVIDGFAYAINFKELFDYTYRSCEFGVVSSKWNKNAWVFGMKFLKQFYSDFDYDKKTITFYSIKEFPYVGNNQVNETGNRIGIRQSVLILNCFVLVVFSGINTVIRYSIKNRMSKKDTNIRE